MRHPDSTPRDRVRTSADAPPRPGPGGFTLVEALIAVTMGTLVVAAAFSLFNSQQEAARASDLRMELQQNARYALDLIRRDLQEAGEGLDPTTPWGVVAMVDGAGAGVPDSLYLLYVEPGTPGHSPTSDNGDSDPSGTVTLRIECDDPVDDLEAGDFLSMANGSARGVALIESVDRQVNDSCTPGDPGSMKIGEAELSIAQIDGEGHGWIWEEGRNDDQAAFKEVQAVAYYLDERDPDNPKLVRATQYSTGGDDAGWSGRPLAEGASEFQVGMIFASGDTLPGADATDGDPDNDHDDVNSVIVRLRVLARRTDPAVAGGDRLGREYAITVTPRNQIYTRNLQD